MSFHQQDAPSIDKLERCLGKQKKLLHTLSNRPSSPRSDAIHQLLEVGFDTLQTSHLADHLHGSGVTRVSSAPSGTNPHWRQLLESLCPLTHSSASEADELAPHSQPKAQELFQTLVKGVQGRPWYMISPNVSM